MLNITVLRLWRSKRSTRALLKGFPTPLLLIYPYIIYIHACINAIVFWLAGSYTINMTYEVGDYIDLSHLNDRSAAQAPAADSGRQSWSFPVGTHIDFTQATRVIIRVPVAFA